MGPRVRNTILSLVAALAATLIVAFIALITGAVASDYIRTAVMLYVVAGVSLIIIIFVSFHEDDKADRMWLGALMGAMIIMSLLAGLGIHFQIFTSEQMAKTVMVIVTGVDALLSLAYWVHTAYVNDDFVS